MLFFMRVFLILTLLYHILVVTLGYGIFGGSHPQIPALLRDGLWFWVFGISILISYKHIFSYLRQWKKVWFAFGWLILFSLLISYFQNKTISDMFIGFKYGFQYLLILLSASFFGFIFGFSKFAKEKIWKHTTIQHFFQWIIWILVGIVVGGIVWQGAKLLWPDFFFHIGYWPLDDFHFGAKPPIYYLTWLGGKLRLQGIFSGPNNYGYFLVAFLPLILAYFRFQYTQRKQIFTEKQNLISLVVLFVWLASILCTLSRTAIIGTAVVLILWNIRRLKKHRKWWIGIGLVFLWGIIGLSVLKWTSTLAHISAKFSSLQYVVQQPLGYGLGTSGPAIHHNWTILPENYFVQLMIDIGTIGFLFWILTVWQIQKHIKKIYISLKKSETYLRDISLIRAFSIWWIALLVMGIFLHVFEDSMVNYSFFVLWGFILGFSKQK